MLCENCQKRIASVHFTKVVNDKKVELYLCDQCAKEKGQFNFGMPLNINDFLSGVMGFGQNIPYTTASPNNISCDKCGVSYEEFKRTGKLSCSECYSIYGERLEPLLKRVHGNIEHHGKVPQKVSKSKRASEQLKKLKEQLQRHVQNEEYEKAAQLRDKIRAIESKELKKEKQGGE